MVDALFADLSSEQRPKPIPPETDGLMADINAPFEQDILDLAQRKRIPDLTCQCHDDSYRLGQNRARKATLNA